MRTLTVFLMLILTLTACTGSTNPAKDIKEASGKESPSLILDRTFNTSLLAMQWKGKPEGSILFPVDPLSGKPLPAYTPISLGYSSFQAFSPDRRTLAVVSFSDENAFDGSLLLVDLPTWKTQRIDLELIGWVTNMVFSPNGQRLAIAHGETSNKITMFDMEKRVIIAQTSVEPNITQMKFTTSGDALMLYGQKIGNRFTELEKSEGAPQVLLLNAEDLSPRWSASLGAVHDGIYPTDESVTAANLYEPGNALYLSPGLVFAPDQDLLYVLHPDSEQLTTVDYGTRKVTTIEIEDQLSWFERLLSLTAGKAHAKVANGTSKQAVISPDGRLLYVVGVNHDSSEDQNGNLNVEQTPLGLDILQASNGQRIQHLETDATEFSLSPDGKLLYLRGWDSNTPWTEVFDLSTRQMTAHKAEISAQPALLMNGHFLLASTYAISESSYRMSILAGTNLDIVSSWTGEDYVFWLPAP